MQGSKFLENIDVASNKFCFSSLERFPLLDFGIGAAEFRRHSLPSCASSIPFTTDTNDRRCKKGVLVLRKWTRTLHHVFSG